MLFHIYKYQVSSFLPTGVWPCFPVKVNSCNKSVVDVYSSLIHLASVVSLVLGFWYFIVRHFSQSQAVSIGPRLVQPYDITAQPIYGSKVISVLGSSVIAYQDIYTKIQPVTFIF